MRTRLAATTISSPSPARLAAFYSRLLGWPITLDKGGWVELAAPSGGPGLSFHDEKNYSPPTWPAAPGQPQMQLHLDIEVDDLSSGVEFALSLGATLAEFQPQPDVRVCLDPDGHPFCLFTQPDGSTPPAQDS